MTLCWESQKPVTTFYALWIYLVFFRTNHSVESSLHQNKTLSYFRLTSSALVCKNKKQQKMEKRKILINLELL